MLRGKLGLEDRDEFLRLLSLMADGDVSLRVERVTNRRSKVANRYYFGVVLKLAEEHSGHSKAELHSLMCEKFLGRPFLDVNRKTGEVLDLTIPGRSSGLAPWDFHDFVEQVRFFVEDFYDMTIPDPDKNYRQARALAEVARGEYLVAVATAALEGADDLKRIAADRPVLRLGDGRDQ